jgi:3-hydroxyisobutyrate dehydrogenase-like beta-hydroxyacid dehydrogenase
MAAEFKVGFVGAGSMGTPMVERLHAEGTPVTLYARRAEVREQFAAAGIDTVDSLAAMADGAEVVLACVYSDDQLRELASGPDGLLAMMEPGSVLASHVTGSPALAVRLAEEAASTGVRFVDAPISGSNDDIAAGRLTVMLGGEPTDTARVRSAVEAYSEAVFDTGAVGSALAVKLINNTLFAANTQLVAEAERIGRSLGADPVALSDIVQRSSGASYVMGLLAQFGSTQAFADLAGHYMLKDLAVVNEVAAELGVDLGLLGRVANADAVAFEARPG